MSFKHTTPTFESNITVAQKDINGEIVRDAQGKTVYLVIDTTTSKYLTDVSGNYVIDPTSPTGEPYIVPANMDFDKTIEEFTELFINTPVTSALLLANFKTGGSFDLQRTDIYGTHYQEYPNPDGSMSIGFVSDYTPSASLYFGAVSAALTVPANIAEIGGGLLNLKNSLSNDSINTSGNYWNNPNNVQNIREGLSYYQNNISTNPSIDFLLNALDMLKDAQGSLAGAAWGIADAVSGLFGSAQGYDPLVFDMDGDGIETIQINTNSPILFDHNSNGVKTATGWVKSDDALLVLDRNANGTIDNGSELFGDQTIVNGVKATDGFAALSAEDTNNNGIFDINDTNFNNVRLWQDLNQNGISEANELFTLETMNVRSINLTAEEAGWIINGNTHTHTGTYTKNHFERMVA